MARRLTDEDIDRLYQLQPREFTRERNALAKEAGGDEGKRIRALPKPSTPAWAVNQLHWRDRRTYDALVAASERLRAAHRAVLGGRKADLRGADAAHREALKAALASTLRIANETGQAISPATQTEIARTLESLPTEDPPGRLARLLQPHGFEALQGMPIRAPEAPAARKAAPGKETQVDNAAEERKRAQALQAVRERERRDRAAVAKLQAQVATAERTTAAAKRNWERAQEAEAKLKTALQQAEASLERSVEERRRAVSEAEGTR